MNLSTIYANTAGLYIKAFTTKHGYEFEYWVGDFDIAYMADLFINYAEIRFDIDNDVPAGLFIQWYDYSLDAYGNGDSPINYMNWLKLKEI